MQRRGPGRREARKPGCSQRTVDQRIVARGKSVGRPQLPKELVGMRKASRIHGAPHLPPRPWSHLWWWRVAVGSGEKKLAQRRISWPGAEQRHLRRMLWRLTVRTSIRSRAHARTYFWWWRVALVSLETALARSWPGESNRNLAGASSLPSLRSLLLHRQPEVAEMSRFICKLLVTARFVGNQPLPTAATEASKRRMEPSRLNGCDRREATERSSIRSRTRARSHLWWWSWRPTYSAWVVQGPGRRCSKCNVQVRCHTMYE